MSELVITQAQSADYPELLTVLNEGTARKLFDYEDTSWGASEWSEQDLVNYGAEGFYLARREGLAVATISLRWSGDASWESEPGDAGYIRHMVVMGSFRGQGLGAEMIRWAAEQAAGKDRDALRLDCDVRNESLCGHYQALGFVMLGTREVPQYGDYVAALFQGVVAELLAR